MEQFYSKGTDAKLANKSGKISFTVFYNVCKESVLLIFKLCVSLNSVEDKLIHLKVQNKRILFIFF